jgi:hypothetical protein
MRTRPETLVQDAVVTVEPGQMAQTVMTVRNVGDEIAEYEVSIVPDCVAAPWAEAVPATFRLMPGRDQQVTLRFRPPLDSSTPAGSFPYGVLVAPKEARHQAPVVVEGDLAVGAVHALDVRLRPPQSRGRWRGRHTVEIRNEGTEDVRVKLHVADDDEALSYALAPTTVTVPPRKRAEAFLRIRSRTPQLLGRPTDHAFAVTYRRRADSRVAFGNVPSDGEVAVDVPGTFTQKPLIPRWMLVLLALLAVAAVLLLTLRPWEKPPPRRPPAPLANVTMVSSVEDEVIVSWDTRPDVTAVEMREVECATAADVIPVAVGEVTSVETSGSGRQMYTLSGLAGAPERCLQVRAVADKEASIWGPRPAVRVRLGQTLPPPADVEAVHAGDCAVDIRWAALAPESGDVVYQVAVDGTPAGSPLKAAGLVLEDQPAGETVEVTVEAAVGQLRSAASEPVEVEIPDPCIGTEGSEAGTGTNSPPGSDGGETSTTTDGSGSGNGQEGIVRLEDRFWLLILPPAGRLDEQDFNLWVTQWQAFGARDVGLTPSPQPRLGTVGADVILPDELGSGGAGQQGPVIPPGTKILYVDLYEEDEAKARANCAALNKAADSVDFLLFSPPCRLVHPDGKVEDVAPSP